MPVDRTVQGTNESDGADLTPPAEGPHKAVLKSIRNCDLPVLKKEGNSWVKVKGQIKPGLRFVFQISETENCYACRSMTYTYSKRGNLWKTLSECYDSALSDIETITNSAGIEFVPESEMPYFLDCIDALEGKQFLLTIAHKTDKDTGSKIRDAKGNPFVVITKIKPAARYELPERSVKPEPVVSHDFDDDDIPF